MTSADYQVSVFDMTSYQQLVEDYLVYAASSHDFLELNQLPATDSEFAIFANGKLVPDAKKLIAEIKACQTADGDCHGSSDARAGQEALRELS